MEKFIRITIIIALFGFFIPNICESKEIEQDHLKRNLSILGNIEKQHDVTFYFRRNWLQDIELNKVGNEKDLKSVLEAVFRNTGLFYTIYKEDKIFLTRGSKISANIQEETDLEDLEQEDQTLQEDRLEMIQKEEKRIHQIGTPGTQKETVVLKGQIKELNSGQELIGASVFIEGSGKGTTSDADGNYRIELPVGYHVLKFSYLGMKSTVRKIQLYSNGSMDVTLVQKPTDLGEVYVTAESVEKERRQIGFEKLEAKEISEFPSFMGEVDIIKHSLLLPGIQSAGEGDMRFNVRGGKSDQNLVLVEGMHSYSNSHFFGFFPAINSALIDNAEFYKAGIPLEYGGRISSVYNIELNKGNPREFSMNGGISPVSAKVAAEGPIIKNKLTFSGGFRKTYSNWVMGLFETRELTNSSLNFSDYQVKLSYRDHDKMSVTGFFYKSHDDFSLHQDSTFIFSNQIGSINFNYQFNRNTSVHSTLGFTEYSTTREEIPGKYLALQLRQNIKDFKFSTNFKHKYNDFHELLAGVNFVSNEIKPWSKEKGDELSLVNPVSLNEDKALRGAFYIGDKITLSSRLTVDVGIRYSLYALLGEENYFKFQDGLTHMDYIQDTISYGSNEIAYFDGGPEFRISSSYELVNNQYLNFGYDHNRQYIHLLTNTQASSPVDSWQLSNKNIPPQVGDHLSLGYTVDFKRGKYAASADIYYKHIRNIKDFIDGSQFELNQHPETEIVDGTSQSYGFELMLQKNRGRISGWIAYTFSRAFIKSESKIPEKIINNGEYYPASFDKPHNLSMVINVEPTRRLVLSNVINFSSGVPITLPVAQISTINSQTDILIYSARNEYRIPFYFRYDLSLTYKGSLKKNKLFSSEWSLSVYNITGRKNPYSIYYRKNQNGFQGYKMSIFGEPIPTLTYKFKF
jgi:hypothetical protein